jgi:hypothetical protein
MPAFVMLSERVVLDMKGYGGGGGVDSIVGIPIEKGNVIKGSKFLG